MQQQSKQKPIKRQDVVVLVSSQKMGVRTRADSSTNDSAKGGEHTT